MSDVMTDKLLATPFGDISVSLHYNYKTVYDVSNPAKVVRENLDEIEKESEFKFYAARVVVDEQADKPFKAGQVLRADKDCSQFTINNVVYDRLEGSFKISPEKGLYWFTAKAQRAGQWFDVYGALTDGARKKLEIALTPILTEYMTSERIEAMRKEARDDLKVSLQGALKDAQATLDRYYSALSVF